MFLRIKRFNDFGCIWPPTTFTCHVPHNCRPWVSCATQLSAVSIMCHTIVGREYHVPHNCRPWVSCATQLLAVSIMCPTSVGREYHVPHNCQPWVSCAPQLLAVSIICHTSVGREYHVPHDCRPWVHKNLFCQTMTHNSEGLILSAVNEKQQQQMLTMINKKSQIISRKIYPPVIVVGRLVTGWKHKTNQVSS